MVRPLNLDLSVGSVGSDEDARVECVEGVEGGEKIQEITKDHSRKLITNKDAPPSFWRRQATKFKETVRQSGSFYNIMVACILTFVLTFIVLLVFKPPMVMLAEDGQEPKLSWTRVLVWSTFMTVITFLVAFFSRPKPPPAYVLKS